MPDAHVRKDSDAWLELSVADLDAKLDAHAGAFKASAFDEDDGDDASESSSDSSADDGDGCAWPARA